jgi:hypothetical protein
MRTNAILKMMSGAILSIAAVPALCAHILFGYASQDSSAPIWNSPLELATFTYGLVCLHCGLTTFFSGLSDLRASSQ